jgi:hypothetical protein
VRVKPDGRTGWKRHDRAAWVEQQLGRPGVKAFNNIYTERFYELGQPPGSLGRISLPVADDDAAKAIVLRLIDKLGFDGVDAGANESRFPLVTAALTERRFSDRQVLCNRLPVGSHSKEGPSINPNVASQNPTHAH